MQSLLQNGEKITPKQWKAEIQSLQSEYDSIGKEQTNDRKLSQRLSLELAYADARVIIRPSQKNPCGGNARQAPCKQHYHDAGLSFAELAEKYGCSTRTVRDDIKAAGVSGKPGWMAGRKSADRMRKKCGKNF